jgi:hypothetical protein
MLIRLPNLLQTTNITNEDVPTFLNRKKKINCQHSVWACPYPDEVATAAPGAQAEELGFDALSLGCSTQNTQE